VFIIRIEVLYIETQIEKRATLTRPKGLSRDKNRAGLFSKLWFRKFYEEKIVVSHYHNFLHKEKQGGKKLDLDLISSTVFGRSLRVLVFNFLSTSKWLFWARSTYGPSNSTAQSLVSPDLHNS